MAPMGKPKLNKADIKTCVVVVAVSHDAYRNLDEQYFKSLTCDEAVVVDVKGIYRNRIHELKYWSL